MTKHTLTTKPYHHAGEGQEITLRIVLDKLTLAIITTEQAELVADQVIGDLKKALREAAAKGKLK